MPVPKNEVSHLFTARSKSNEVSEGMWARVKNGNYKGDLGQVRSHLEPRCPSVVFNIYFLLLFSLCRL